MVPSGSSWEGTHGQRLLLIDSVKLYSAHSVGDELKLLRQGLAAVRHADIGDVGPADVVAHWTFLKISRAQPVAFHLEVGEST